MPERSSPPARTASAADGAPAATERIERRLARAGLCSRRDAKRWIAEGRVSVDGRVIDAASHPVGPTTRITVDGRPVPPLEPTRLWRCHKPTGVVTTSRDPEGRPTLFSQLPDGMPRVISVGRLDLPTEGLILLTNDGALARALELPATGWIRRYRARVHGEVDTAALERLERGATIDGVRYGPVQARLDRRQGSNAWLTVALTEGRNREVRRVLSHLGLTVTRLIRLSYGPFQLGHLERGMVDEVAARVLRDQVGHLIDRTRPDASAALRTARRTAAPQAPALPIVGRGKPRPDRAAAPEAAPARTGAARTVDDPYGSDPGSGLHIVRRPGTARPAARKRPPAGGADAPSKTAAPKPKRGETAAPKPKRGETAAPKSKRGDGPRGKGGAGAGRRRPT